MEQRRILLQVDKQSCKLQDMTAAQTTPYGDTETMVPPSHVVPLPDTDYNMGAWMTFTASLSEDERRTHYESCREEHGGILTDCPLCNAVAKLRGLTRVERRTPYRFYAGRNWATPRPLPKWQAEQRRAALHGADTAEDKLARQHAESLLARYSALNNLERLAERIISRYAPEQTATGSPFRVRVLAVLADLSDPENHAQAVSWLTTIVAIGVSRRNARRYTPLVFSKHANTISAVAPDDMASLGALPSVWLLLLSIAMPRPGLNLPRNGETAQSSRYVFDMPVSVLPTVSVLLTACLITAGAPQSFRTVAYPNTFGVCRVRGALARPVAV